MKGVTFGNFHSWDDFSLILNKKSIETPSPKTSTVEIPGADGVLDVSEYFGEIKYKNRKLSFDFSSIVPQEDFLDLFSEIQNNLHGQKVNIVLDDDPNFYYVGRLNVSGWKTTKNIGKVTISCDCEPYKYKLNETIVSQAVDGSSVLTLPNLRKRVNPTFVTDAEIQVLFGSSTYTISAGTFVIPEIAFVAGNNTLTIIGTANVSIKYQEGGL